MDKFIQELKKLLQVLALLEEALIKIISIAGWIMILLYVLGVI